MGDPQDGTDEETTAETRAPAPAEETPEESQAEHVVHEGQVEFEGEEGATAEPEGAVADGLREGLDAMRDELRRIADLGTGAEQVEGAERFAEDAGRLDEQIGSAARAADDDHG